MKSKAATYVPPGRMLAQQKTMSGPEPVVLQFPIALEESSAGIIELSAADSSATAKLDLITNNLEQLLARARTERTVYLHSLAEPSLRLRLPLAVSTIEQSEIVTASIDEFDLYADGDTVGEALEQLRRLIVEEYGYLRANAARLGPLPAMHFRGLRDLIEETDGFAQP